MSLSALSNSSVAQLLEGLSNEDVWLEEERSVAGGSPVRGARFSALVRILVNCFDERGGSLQEADKFPDVVFLMHRWFTTSIELSEQLITLFCQADQIAVCSSLTCCHSSSDGCAVAVYRLKVCHAIRYWIMNFPMQFDMENGLSASLKDFQATLSPPLANLVDQSQVPSYDWMRHVSVRNNNTQTQQVSRKVSLVLNNLEPAQLAEHITSLEHKIIRRISFQDYKKYADSGSLRDAPRLEHSVALFNGLTQWIQCLVLSRTTPQQRADVIAKFINVAKKLLEMQNFNSLMCVVASVSHSVLARLSKTMACLPNCRKKLLAELTDLLSTTNNFQNYRKTISECRGFNIPILGIHLKDLIALHVALPDMVQDDMINVRKVTQLSTIFRELEQLQMSAPPVEPNMDLVNTLRLSLDLAYTDDEIYELSLAREPRNTSSPQCSPSVASVVFAEWAGGPSPPPHPHTIEKHVTTMVDAVFNNYDTDRDGYISHEEFEAVATNFPFIASFCVLDADHDGMISHEEMKKYFIHANCHALKSRFKHEFHETTYFKPTFCAHCAGLLWGLIRQGYKCRDCAINAHKHCKDLVVMECRLRDHNSSADSSSHALSSRRKFRRKKKSSVSESESPASSPKSSTSSSLSISDYDSWRFMSDTTMDGGGSLPPSPKSAGPRRKISDSLLVPSLNRAAARLKPQTSCPESCYSAHPPLRHQPTIQPPPCLPGHKGTVKVLSQEPGSSRGVVASCPPLASLLEQPNDNSSLSHESPPPVSHPQLDSSASVSFNLSPQPHSGKQGENNLSNTSNQPTVTSPSLSRRTFPDSQCRTLTLANQPQSNSSSFTHPRLMNQPHPQSVKQGERNMSNSLGHHTTTNLPHRTSPDSQCRTQPLSNQLQSNNSSVATNYPKVMNQSQPQFVKKEERAVTNVLSHHTTSPSLPHRTSPDSQCRTQSTPILQEPHMSTSAPSYLPRGIHRSPPHLARQGENSAFTALNQRKTADSTHIATSAQGTVLNSASALGSIPSNSSPTLSKRADNIQCPPERSWGAHPELNVQKTKNLPLVSLSPNGDMNHKFEEQVPNHTGTGTSHVLLRKQSAIREESDRCFDRRGKFISSSLSETMNILGYEVHNEESSYTNSITIPVKTTHALNQILQTPEGVNRNLAVNISNSQQQSRILQDSNNHDFHVGDALHASSLAATPELNKPLICSQPSCGCLADQLETTKQQLEQAEEVHELWPNGVF